MKSIRAKFNVLSVIGTEENGSTIDLQAVTTGSPENEEFFKFTPSGHITMSVVDRETAKVFKEAKTMYVEFFQDELVPVEAPSEEKSSEEKA